MNPEELDKVFSGLNGMRKVSRIASGIIFVLCAIMVAGSIIAWILNPSTGFPFDVLLGMAFFLFIGLIFWHVPSWFADKFEQVASDPDSEMHRVEAREGRTTVTHVEITSRVDDETTPFIIEDEQGVVLFDSTQRPVRLMFGGFFFIIGFVVFVAMMLMSKNPGLFEYVFGIGWCGLAAIVMGFVYEVRLHKRENWARRKIGWFFIVFRRRYALDAFTLVKVESRLHRSRYDATRERMTRQDPKFSVDLVGEHQRLNLRVFGSLAEARQLGHEAAAYLNLPIEEGTEIV